MADFLASAHGLLPQLAMAHLARPPSAPTLTLPFALVGISAVASLVAAPTPARACGGCFAPIGTVTVVTAHRMAVAITPSETTLWDQIQYAGDPEDFVWVLPIRGENLVELADNAFFEALDQATQIQLRGTFPPLQAFCGRLASASDGDSFGPPPSDNGVTVYGEAVVGPYFTATIGSDDPAALLRWLTDNDYAVPDSILPTIAHYVDLGSNFAVLRLHPNAGVSQMQPVRITTPGLMPTFPLRMVAAGVAGQVGLQLYIFGEGRYGADNFPVVEVDPNDLYFDWARGEFNYDEVFAAAIATAHRRGWVAEYAQPYEAYGPQVAGYVTVDDDGTEHRSADDLAVITRSLATPYLTKIRTDLDASFLDQDIVLVASDGPTVNSVISVDRERNRPPEPRCADSSQPEAPGGGVVGMPASRTGFRDDPRGDGLCSVPGFGTSPAGGHDRPPVLPLALLGLIGFLAYRRRRA